MEPATRLLTIPGVGKRVAEVVVAEIGVDIERGHEPVHLRVQALLLWR